MTSKEPRSFSLDPDVIEEMKRRDDFNASGDVNDYLRRRLLNDDPDKSRDIAQLEHMIEEEEDKLEDVLDDVQKHARRLRDLEEELEELKNPELSDEVIEKFDVIRRLEKNGYLEEQDYRNQAKKVDMAADVFKRQYKQWRDEREEEVNPRTANSSETPTFKSTSD